MPDRISLNSIRFGLEEKWEEMKIAPIVPKEKWLETGNRHVFFAFPPKAQNQQIKAGLLAHLIFAGLLIPILVRRGGSGQWHSGAKTFFPIAIGTD